MKSVCFKSRYFHLQFNSSAKNNSAFATLYSSGGVPCRSVFLYVNVLIRISLILIRLFISYGIKSSSVHT